ncbi:hypothetical protein KR50_06370 [Jeotgalibacillus campisalis]|uniref:Uncharacterized protein n=1 Tax=Jeotgalibacillus campisalis TaxID=220754 RepID=A0A0C2VTK7_9BACL|nr:hypothetical protein KR50_06370 [Jeotgalibacillus campisalis]
MSICINGSVYGNNGLNIVLYVENVVNKSLVFYLSYVHFVMTLSKMGLLKRLI